MTEKSSKIVPPGAPLSPSSSISYAPPQLAALPQGRDCHENVTDHVLDRFFQSLVWTVVRTGSITKACEELRLAPPTVSAQLKSFEDQLGKKLLKRSGRNLVATEIGQAVYRQAEEIFSIGREIMDTVKQRKAMFPVVPSVGHVLLIYLEQAHTS